MPVVAAAFVRVVTHPDGRSGHVPPRECVSHRGAIAPDGAVYPLRVYVCEHCWLVQREACTAPEAMFSDYAYFSSYSDPWLHHAKAYVAMAVDRFRLTATSHIVEIASNDGYPLQYFVARGLRCSALNPPPTWRRLSISAVSRRSSGIRRGPGQATRGARHAGGPGGRQQCARACARVNDFVSGLKSAETARGPTLEFPDLLRLLAEKQFDTIYHEHFS